MTATAIRRQLAACNGGPGLTVADLAARTGFAPAHVRNELARLMFGAREVTTDTEGRFKLGDPTAPLVADIPESAPLCPTHGPLFGERT